MTMDYKHLEEENGAYAWEVNKTAMEVLRISRMLDKRDPRQKEVLDALLELERRLWVVVSDPINVDAILLKEDLE